MIGRSLQHQRRAMTLVEVMVSSFIASVVGLGVSSIVLISAKATSGVTRQALTEVQCRGLFNQLRDSIQYASSVALSPDGLELTISDFVGNDEKYAIAQGELRHYDAAGATNFDVILDDIASDSIFEVISNADKLQLVHVLIGVRDPQNLDGMNYYYIDARLSTRVLPLPAGS